MIDFERYKRNSIELLERSDGNGPLRTIAGRDSKPGLASFGLSIRAALSGVLPVRRY